VSASSADSAERALLRAARRSLGEGRPHEVLERLRGALRRRSLSPQGIERAGALVREALATTAPLPGRVLLLGQCTTSWLKNALAAITLGAGFDAMVDDGQYDNVLQDVAALPPYESGEAPILVLLPWNDRLLAPSTLTHDQRVESEVGYWREVWRAARARGVTRIIQVGFDWIGPGALGHHLTGLQGDVRLVRDANEAIRRELPEGSYFVPLDEISGVEGRNGFYDRRNHFWTRQPLSERGLVLLAEQIVAGVRALTTGPRKVLVLDLDNTLWGGIVGEVGAMGIALGGTPEGEAYLAFQRHLRALAGRGVLLAVCSKNNPADAREPFSVNPDVALALDDFAAFEANWAPKVESLRKIAATLNIGLDAFVFFDDNPAEREHVCQALPEVLVVDVPEDPSDYVRALEATLVFEAVSLTEEDRRRRELYSVERLRREEATEAGSVGDYLRSLEMRASLRPIDEADLPRVVQLLGKTNQFNLTTRRHGASEVRAILARPGAIGFTLRLRDRFGDHGLVAVVLAAPVETEHGVLRVDTMLMSCRVIGRTAEQLLVRHLIGDAKRVGYVAIRADFVPTAKNAQVRGVWPSMGFLPVRTEIAAADGTETFELRLTDAALPESFVQVGD
jgi:FkbH-like protein